MISPTVIKPSAISRLIFGDALMDGSLSAFCMSAMERAETANDTASMSIVIDAVKIFTSQPANAKPPISSTDALAESLLFASITSVRSNQGVAAHAQRDLAAIPAVGANRGNVVRLPRPRLIAITPAGQRAHRANVDAHAALFAVHWSPLSAQSTRTHHDLDPSAHTSMPSPQMRTQR